MGFRLPRLFKRDRESPLPQRPNLRTTSERFAANFPRLFAYVRSCVGGDVPAQDIAVEAFSDAFSKAKKKVDDDEFQRILFRAARRLCRPALKESHDDRLTAREREVLALVFDAGFTRAQIAAMFRISPGAVSSHLLSGLRKLKEETSPAAAAAYLKLA